MIAVADARVAVARVRAQQAAREVEQPGAVGELEEIAVRADDRTVLVLTRRDEDMGVVILVPGLDLVPIHGVAVGVAHLAHIRIGDRLCQ